MSEVIVKLTPPPKLVTILRDGPSIGVKMVQPPPIITKFGTMGARGLKGDKGDPGEAGIALKQFEAGENISSGVAVIVSGGKAFRFDPNDLTHLGRVMGVTTSSGTAGGQITVQLNGEATDAAFELEPEKPCFVNAQGKIVTGVPDTKIIQPLGVSINAHSFYLNILTPIKK